MGLAIAGINTESSGAGMRARRLWTGLAALLLAACFAPRAAHADPALWSLLRSGEAFAIMRHALAPGTGDPGRFQIDDCSTQRNLDARGREQARAIGAAFKANGIATAEVLTSQWCRCRETALLLGLGAPQDLPPLNSFFQAMENRTAQTAELKAWLQANPQSGPRVLSTHQVNISALTGQFTRSGEVVVVTLSADGRAKVHGSLQPG